LAISCKWEKPKNTTENVKNGNEIKTAYFETKKKKGMNQRNPIPNTICVKVSAFMASTVIEL